MTIPDLAARQLRDYLHGTPGTYFAENHPLLAFGEAYLVQAEVAKLRSAAGDSIAGYKIECIGPKIREASGMSGPIRGLLYSSELHPSGNNSLRFETYLPSNRRRGQLWSMREVPKKLSPISKVISRITSSRFKLDTSS